MKTMVILYLWQALTATQYRTEMGWVDRGLYSTVEACENAATRRLNMKENYYQCIPQ